MFLYFLFFFVWGYLKDRVYQSTSETLNDLKLAIKQEIKRIIPVICPEVILNLRDRIERVLSPRGRIIKHDT